MYSGLEEKQVEPRDTDASPVARNRRFYTAWWSAITVVSPERFNTWPLLSRLAESAGSRLEVGCGLHPRLPVAGTWFVDISREGLTPLRAHGGLAIQAEATALPFDSASFDLVCAFDIVEHVADDQRLFRELSRVARPGAPIVFSVPLHPGKWSVFDELVGHVRRYDPGDLLSTLRAHDLVVERSATFGMAPRSRWLLHLAAWWMTHKPRLAMRWYDAALRPLGLRLQRPLALAPGLIDPEQVGEILLVCRRSGERDA
jgi:SAM-dependent methyltransferase